MQQPLKYFHKRLNSTNLYATQMVSELPEKVPFWIRTDDQYEGKGQGSHTWVSQPGLNITGTLVIFPDQLEASDQFTLSKTFSLAIACFLELFIDEVKIKWPNDLYAGDKKIAGILIETAIMGKYISHAVLGVGVNINQKIFPSDIPNAVSVSILTGLDHNLPDLEQLLIESFLNQYRMMEATRFNEINDQYINRLFRYNEWAYYRALGKTLYGKITGVNEYGHLMIETGSGLVESFAYQEVEYILNP